MDFELINGQEYETAREELGANFVRILGYFREDGLKSVEQVEEAMRTRNSAALIIPAHTLKGESRQFGSKALGDLAEKIEMTARHCVETRTGPEELIAEVAGLRECFTRTLVELEKHSSPVLAQRKSAGFGRKVSLSSLTGLTRG
ncbi:MAG: Hpt domain-containing protein [Sphingobium sp.]|jgi:HPt (histidine-containing phosphotransfer) domain-containing protein|nr:Hpt domain-containing protein [Sphingobium sp.]MCP5399671.1 Hpt domain-containing protein [Sphingomonas sp.]